MGIVGIDAEYIQENSSEISSADFNSGILIFCQREQLASLAHLVLKASGRWLLWQNAAVFRDARHIASARMGKWQASRSQICEDLNAQVHFCGYCEVRYPHLRCPPTPR